ncbi:DMT (drug/metabolite family transporter) superfamily permease [Haloferax elongans ATCC BAA-1513]|uniref:DMT (Drug/metabolite family transporter) superfamily permease n=1 Tax=Haloferax elongans ATCC BAA-1513 TaxID=1230453 RepID=M0HJY6_HALEO|nr:DMT family transporter [Haloferax elongans]ELZ84811.1 DMT (drug/metabolite family transporter) superfamily permease [Haloferax elongans ATCC BAA-1513]
MNRRVAVGLFALLGGLWGSSFVAIEIGLEFFPPLHFAAFRYYLAGVIVLGYALVSTDYWRPRNRTDLLLVAIAGGLMIGGHHAFLYVGQQYVPGAVAAIVISLGPVLTALFATGILGDRLSPLGAAGFAFGFLGVGLVAQPDPNALLSSDVVGVGIVFVAAVCFALGAVLTRPYSSDIPARTLQAWAMLFGAALLHVGGVATNESVAAIEWTPTAIGSLAYLATISGAAAFLIYFELLSRFGPTQINLIGYLEPVSATLLSWAFLGHLIDPLTAVGFVSIFVGFALIKRRALSELVVSVRHQSSS